MSKRTNGGQPRDSQTHEPVFVIAQRPVTLVVRKSGKDSYTEQTEIIYLDRGINVLSASLPSWELLENAVGTPHSGAGLKKIDVGVSFDCPELKKMVDGNNRPIHRKRQELLVSFLNSAKENSKTSYLFEGDVSRGKVPTLCYGTLDELKAAANFGGIQQAVLLTGGAHGKRNQSFYHLGAVHDLAFVQGLTNIVSACRLSVRRFRAAAA